MSSIVVAEYLSRLLNRTVVTDTQLVLTSAQRARFHAWLLATPISFDVAVLDRPFSIDKLLARHNTAHQPVTGVSPAAAAIDVSGNETIIGVDIQRISELFPVDFPNDLKASAELRVIFTPKELSYAETRPTPIATLTGIFAAKEAILKCMEGVVVPVALSELEILPDASGRPATTAGFRISISHSGEYAVAIAQRNVRTLEAPSGAGQNSAPGTTSTIAPATSPATRLRKLDFLMLALLGTLILAVAVLYFAR